MVGQLTVTMKRMTLKVAPTSQFFAMRQLSTLIDKIGQCTGVQMWCAWWSPTVRTSEAEGTVKAIMATEMVRCSELSHWGGDDLPSAPVAAGRCRHDCNS